MYICLDFPEVRREPSLYNYVIIAHKVLLAICYMCTVVGQSELVEISPSC